jgi:hypothetical protein
MVYRKGGKTWKSKAHYERSRKGMFASQNMNSGRSRRKRSRASQTTHIVPTKKGMHTSSIPTKKVIYAEWVDYDQFGGIKDIKPVKINLRDDGKYYVSKVSLRTISNEGKIQTFGNKATLNETDYKNLVHNNMVRIKSPNELVKKYR